MTETLLVFDAVGTLIRPRESISAVYRQAGVRHGIPLEQATVRERFQAARRQIFGNEDQQVSSEPLERERWSELVRTVFRELVDSSDLFQDLWEYYALPRNWLVFSDVGDCLGELLDRRQPVAIASNFDARLLEICRELPPLDRIPPVFCSGLLGFCKPDPRFFAAVLARLRDSWPELADLPRVMIGDDPDKDVVAARNAGWQARLLDRTQQDFPSLVASLLDR